MTASNRTPEELRKLIAEITKVWTDQGKVIEGGWWAFATVIGLENAPEVQRAEMRKAFMAGAQHLLTSMIDIMDARTEPTAQDLKRMDLIHAELEAFARSLR